MSTTNFSSAIENAHEAIDLLEAEAYDAFDSAKPVILKAIKGNTRFKNTSVWVKTKAGYYKHVQSGKFTTADRLAGYTEPFTA
jgi:hypothetical protein